MKTMLQGSCDIQTLKVQCLKLILNNIHTSDIHIYDLDTICESIRTDSKIALVSKSLWFRFPYPCEYKTLKLYFYFLRLGFDFHTNLNHISILSVSFETHIYACGSIEFCIFPFVIFQSNGASLLFLLQESLVTMSMSKTHSIIQR